MTPDRADRSWPSAIMAGTLGTRFLPRCVTSGPSDHNPTQHGDTVISDTVAR